jgi:hypothetical protein
MPRIRSPLVPFRKLRWREEVEQATGVTRFNGQRSRSRAYGRVSGVHAAKPATPTRSAGRSSPIGYWQFTEGSLLRAIVEARPDGLISSRDLDLIEGSMVPEVERIVARHANRPLCDLTRARLRRELRELGALMKQLCLVEEAPEPIVRLDGSVTWETVGAMRASDKPAPHDAENPARAAPSQRNPLSAG